MLENLAAELREPRLELAAGFLAADAEPPLRQDGAGVELDGPLHERHAGLEISREDRVRDRRGAAPPRQKRGVDVHRAPVSRVEQVIRDSVPVGRPDQNLRSQRRKRNQRRRVEASRLEDRDPELSRDGFRRRLAQRATRAGTVGLGHHADDPDGAALTKTVECLERRHGERRRAQEEDAGR